MMHWVTKGLPRFARVVRSQSEPHENVAPPGRRFCAFRVQLACHQGACSTTPPAAVAHQRVYEWRELEIGPRD